MKAARAAILSDDPVFSNLLRIELKYLGADAGMYQSGREYDFFIVDTDTVRIPQGVVRERCLTFSKTDARADLRRPFLIEDFRALAAKRFGLFDAVEASSHKEAGDISGDELFIDAEDAFFGKNALFLTKTELALLKLLAEADGDAVTEEEIRRRVFPGSTGNAVQVYIRYLRQKLEKHTRFHYVECLRGKGYRLSTDGLTVVIREKEGANG